MLPLTNATANMEDVGLSAETLTTTYLASIPLSQKETGNAKSEVKLAWARRPWGSCRDEVASLIISGRILSFLYVIVALGCPGGFWMV